MAGKRSLVRGGITLAVLAALAGAMVIAPAGAHVTGKFGHLKKHFNKIAKKQAKRVFDSKIGAATVANATNATNAGTVDGLDANSLNRAVYVSGGSFLPVPTAHGVAVSTSFTAPVRGVLTLAYSGDWTNGGSTDSTQCELRVDGTFITEGFIRHNGAAGVNTEEDCVVVGGAVVDAGTHTVSAEWDSGDTTNLLIFSNNLIVEFSPFDGAGVTPRLAEGAAGSPRQ